jgi:hypothetical protein
MRASARRIIRRSSFQISGAHVHTGVQVSNGAANDKLLKIDSYLMRTQPEKTRTGSPRSSPSVNAPRDANGDLPDITKL